MRGSRRDQRDHGAVAVVVALVLAFAMIPALALGTGTYVRSSTATELQRSADTGALAGAAEIPLGDLTFAENYISTITGPGVATTLQNLGIVNDPSLQDPLADACATGLLDAKNKNNLGHAYGSAPTCNAKYLPDSGVLGAAQNCVSSIAGLNSITGLVGVLLGALGLGALSPTKLFSALEGTLPALLQPAIQVTMTWKVKAPFDSVFGSNGSTQTSTSIARRRFKNAVVLPNIPLNGSTTVNVNPALQLTRATVLSTLTSVAGVLTKLNGLVPGLGSCSSIITSLSTDIADAVDPPDNGPSLNAILADAAASGSPVLAVSTTVVGLGIPFLDMVPVCISQVNGQYVAHLTSFGSCVLTHQGPFRAVLRNS